MSKDKSLIITPPYAVQPFTDLRSETSYTVAKVRSLLQREFQHYRDNKLAHAVWDIGTVWLENKPKQEVLRGFVDVLTDRYKRKSARIRQVARYISWLLDDTYTWIN